MATSDNDFRAVETYQESGLERLQNMFCFIATCNKKFENFQTMEANLGAAVQYTLPPRAVANPGLIVTTFDSSQQRFGRLQVGGYNSTGTPTNGGDYDQYGNLNACNSNMALSSQQLIYNFQDDSYRRPFEEAHISVIGNQIETSVAARILPGTYRFYGDGITAIDTYEKLATGLAYFRNYGTVDTDTRFYLDDIQQATIVGSGLSKFTLDRNNKAANSWEVGNFDRAEFFVSNKLPIFQAGTLGDAQTVLTVTAITTDTDGGVSAITCSGAGTGTVVLNDLFQFQDGVSGQTNIRFLTWNGVSVSRNTVQCRVVTPATGVAGSIVIAFNPKLYSAAGRDKNINTPVAIGMQIKLVPSHRAGLICSGNPFFLAMPRLPDQSPFPTSNAADPASGASIRLTKGAAFGQNINGYIWDAIWTANLESDYAMRVIFPV